MIYRLKRFSSYLEKSFAVVNPAVAKPATPNPAMQNKIGGGGALGGLAAMAVPTVIGVMNSRSSSSSAEGETEQ